MHDCFVSVQISIENFGPDCPTINVLNDSGPTSLAPAYNCSTQKKARAPHTKREETLSSHNNANSRTTTPHLAQLLTHVTMMRTEEENDSVLESQIEQGIVTEKQDDDVDTKSTDSSGETPQTSDDEGDAYKEESTRCDMVLEVLFVTAVLSSLSIIFLSYARAWDDMQDDPDWSISRILAYDYNLLFCYAGVLPSYLAMIVTYATKFYHKIHVRRAAVVATTGGVLAFTLDVENFPIWHGFAAFLLLTGVVMVRKEATRWQTLLCAIGFALAIPSCVFRLIFRHYAFGLTMALGEFFILVPWAFMMFNKK